MEIKLVYAQTREDYQRYLHTVINTSAQSGRYLHVTLHNWYKVLRGRRGGGITVIVPNFDFWTKPEQDLHMEVMGTIRSRGMAVYYYAW